MSNQSHRIYRSIISLYLLVGVLLVSFGCASRPSPLLKTDTIIQKRPKVFIIILDALKRKTLMESLDSLPNFTEIIKGKDRSYPYIYFENVLVSIPSSSAPSNTTLLTGVYPCRHGVPSTMWFNRKEKKLVTLTSFFQRRIVNILEKTKTDTIFDYARRSGKTMMGVATQAAKGLDSRDWIQQSVHLWGQAFMLNLIKDWNPIPDGAYLDRGTTRGLLSGYMYSFIDGLEGVLRADGDIPDLVVVHYVGLDIFTHYPRRFMIKENWTIDQIQKWYLREVLDPELGKIKAFLIKNNILENTLFFFVADHGQTKIIKHLDEERLTETLSEKFKVMDHPYSVKDANIVIMPGASTKVMYIRNGMNADWMSPPRLLEDVKPVVDVVIDVEDMKTSLNTLLVAQYPGKRNDDIKTSDTFWFFNLSGYRESNRSDNAFINALGSLSGLDELVGRELKAAYMYRRDFHGNTIPDIILINKPGFYFAPDKGKYAHHGGIYHNDAYVSFVISGPGVHLFSDHPHRITHHIDTVDLLPMAAYLSDIKVDKRVDGKNWLLKVQ